MPRLTNSGGSTLSLPLSLANGGTGAATAAAARGNLITPMGAAVTTAGTSTAYTAAVTGYTLTDGALLVVEWHTASTGTSATLNVNSTGAKSIRRSGSATLPVGVLATGRKYEVAYNATADCYDLTAITQVVDSDIAGRSGVILDAGTTSGTSTAYTATLASRPNPLTAGYAFTVRFHTTNGASPTISLSSGTAQALRIKGATPTSSALIANVPYLCISDGTNVHVIGTMSIDQYPNHSNTASLTEAFRTYTSNQLYDNVPSGGSYVRNINEGSQESFSTSAYSISTSASHQIISPLIKHLCANSVGAAGHQYFSTSDASYPGVSIRTGGAVSQASNATWTTKCSLAGASWYGRFLIYDTATKGLAATYEITGTTLSFLSGTAEYVASGSESATTIAFRVSGSNLQIYVGTSVSTRKFAIMFEGVTQ